MALALSAGDWIQRIAYPDPAGFATAGEWVDAFFLGESERGPHRGAEPTLDYAFLWALWLSAVPYGMWSEHVAAPSMEEHGQWLERLEDVLQGALDHFRVTLREGTTVGDLACAIASMIEGVWLNQCLTTRHPTDPSEPVGTVLRRSGRLLWLGATEPRPSSWTRKRR